jgi:uncharacterized membrane protein YccC
VGLGSIVLVLLAVVLLVAAVLLVRSGNRVPWPAVVIAALTSAICYTVGGDSARDASGPSIATVAGSAAGMLTVVAAIMALLPRRATSAASRTPILVCAAGIAVGAVGLLLTAASG